MRGSKKIFAITGMLIISLGYAGESKAVDFAPPVTYPVGTNPAAVVVGDFNGDGKPDTAVANSGSGNVSILLGNGDGTLQAAVNFDAGIANPSILAVGDFNNDGKLDLAAFQPGDPTNSIAGAVSILLSNGNGTFQAAKTTTLTAQAASMAVGDFNSDKKSDIVIGDFDPATSDLTLNLLIGNGDGTFLAPRALSTFSKGTQQWLATDLNGDGKLDLAVGSSASSVSILLGKGDGTFQPAPGGVVNTPLALFSLRAADLTGDGKQDLVVESFLKTTGGGCPPFCITVTTSDLNVFLGNGDGSFQAGQLVFSARGFGSAGPRSYALGDYNGDKKLDLVYATSAASISELLGKGTGAFSIPISIGVSSSSVASAADLNGDALSDLLALGPGNAVSVSLNTGPTSGADLGVMQAGASPEPVGVGNNLTYTADALNQGPKDATGVTFTDTLPSGVSFVSAKATQGSCIQSQGIVACNIGSVASAFDASVTIVVTPTAPGTITNTISVEATESDLIPANNSATQTSTVAPVYTLTVAKAGNGTGTVTSDPGLSGPITCGSACSATYLSGTVVNVSQGADPGSLFQSWGGACSGKGSCSVTMDGDKTITASFVLGVALNVTIAGTGTGSVTSSDGAINCSNSGGFCSALYLPGTSASLTAMASGNATFSGWSGGCTGTDPNACNVTLNSDKTVTATFNPPPDFTPTPAATNLSVNRGGQVSEQLTFPAQGGFSGTIALACSVSGPAPMPTCGISPNSVTPGNNATLTVNASALTAALTPRPFERAGTLYAAWLPVGLLGCVLATSVDKKRRRHWVLCLLMLVATIVPVGCSSGSSTVRTGPPPVNYTVTVTATSGALQHSTNVTVTVQ